MADWHDSSCRCPDVILSSDLGFSSCLSCGAVYSFTQEWEQRQPAVERPDEASEVVNIKPLSWPQSTRYHSSELLHLRSCLDEISRSTGSFSPVNFFRKGLQEARDRFESKPYVYSSLQFPRQIRLLHLHKGWPSQALSGHIELIDLSASPPPEYEAISYTWADEEGDKTLCRRIFLGDDHMALPITHNCDRALRRLRLPRSDRVIWIDAICIDQESSAERSHQVGLMRQIYSFASKVHIYVGEDDASNKSGQLAIQAFRELESEAQGTSQIVDREALLALFFGRPYFSRLWVVQEVLLANQAELHCGESSIELTPTLISRLTQVLQQLPLWLSLARAESGRVPQMTAKDLLRLLVATSSCKVSDLRDKIFALLGLIRDDVSLAPDYSLTVREVYIGIAAYLVQNLGYLFLIRFAGDSESKMRATYALPSWVPCWTDVEVLSRGIDVKSALAAFRCECAEHASLTNTAGVIPRFTLLNPYGANAAGCSAQVDGVSGALILNARELYGVDVLYQSLSLIDWEDNTRPSQGPRFFAFPGGGRVAIWSSVRPDVMMNAQLFAAGQTGGELYLARRKRGDKPVFSLIAPCFVAAMHSSNLGGQFPPTGIARTRFLHDFNPLDRDILVFMAWWRQAFDGEEVTDMYLPLSRAKRMDLAVITSAEQLWQNYQRLISCSEEDFQVQELQEASEAVDSLIRAWLPARSGGMLEHLKQTLQPSFKIQGQPTLANWINRLKYLKGLLYEEPLHKIVTRNEYGNGLRLAPTFGTVLDWWFEDLEQAAQWLKRMFCIDLLVMTNGREILVTNDIVSDLRAQVKDYLRHCDTQEEFIEEMKKLDFFAGADSDLWKSLFDLFQITVPLCDRLEDLLKEQHLIRTLCNVGGEEQIIFA